MELQHIELPPPSILAQSIECIWFMQGPGIPAAEPERVLPDGCLEIVFNLAQPFRQVRIDGCETQPAQLFVGALTGHLTILPTGRIDLVGIRLRPGGASAFFPGPMHELLDRTLPLPDLEGHLPGSLLERLGNLDAIPARYRLLSETLSAAARLDRTDSRVIAASDLIRSTAGSIPVSELARRAGASIRSLERHFKTHVGMGPKLLSRIARFQRAIRQAEMRTPGALRDSALDCGYFDQSHFLKDFCAFAGVSPSIFFEREENRMSQAFTSQAPPCVGNLQYSPSPSE